MKDYSTKRIEEAAVLALKDAFIRCGYIDSSCINTNDRTPSWDGVVLVYKKRSWEKENLLGCAPIQVKGTSKRIVSDVATFSCSMTDLKNYYNNGGIIFFLVSVDVAKGWSHIYYASLLTYDLDKMIRQAKKQATKTIQLKELPVNNEADMANVFFDFITNRPKQMGLIGKDILSIDSLVQNGAEIESLSFGSNILCLNPEMLENYVTTHEFYLYAKPKGWDTEVVVDKITNPSISRCVEGDIVVGDKVYSNRCVVVNSGGIRRIHINKCIEMVFDGDGEHVQFNYKPAGTLSDVIADTALFMAIVEHREIAINGSGFRFEEEQCDFLEKCRMQLTFCQDIKKMLDLLGVNEELNYDVLTEKDFNNLKNFVVAILYNGKIQFPGADQEVLYGGFTIANLVIQIIAMRQEDGSYKIHNLFDEHKAALFLEDDSQKKNPIPASQYLWMRKEAFIHSSNMDYEKIYEDIESKNKTIESVAWTTGLLIEMLKGYDLQEEKEPALLNLAERVCDWIINNCLPEDKDNQKLNKLQIIKRQRAYTVDEIVSLAELKADAKPNAIRCGAFLLLGDNENAQKCFEQLDSDKQREFIGFPIAIFGELKIAAR